tara:strand:- start:37 stop:228 length:192 start_codon:yes stop_codon:yes gene_type:complete
MEIFYGIRFKDFLEETNKKKKELEESHKESLRQTKQRTDGPLDSFSKDLKDSIKKNHERNKND